eukprot:CAMPEP_0196684870 /NCGR_PEP_ID=MMETSP1090-20130531/10845_1 /TAXON_ID=37098 /ORGANISM="Isochrysis sp, Strain CCMP1244" /LENGTH=72 /DNA_ID=CAMNT_0042023365 /DNA_START=57 /DNA_END=275 /DNA_ORIENTATION=-
MASAVPRNSVTKECLDAPQTLFSSRTERDAAENCRQTEPGRGPTPPSNYSPASKHCLSPSAHLEPGWPRAAD